jgi:hypothetical protein
VEGDDPVADAYVVAIGFRDRPAASGGPSSMEETCVRPGQMIVARPRPGVLGPLQRA